MSENIKLEDIVEKPESTSDTGEESKGEETTETQTPEQDPLKIELDRVQNKPGRTEKEKAEYSLRKNAERVKELGGDPNAILGIEKETPKVDDDDTPVTIGMFKKLQQENASKTALQQADEIQNETERELTKFHLENTIKSTGIPSEDLKLARALVNSVKNTKIIEEVARKTPPKTHSNSSGVNANKEEEVVLTTEEKQLMAAGNLTVKEVLDARAGKKFSFDSLKAQK
jgi:hypothetical protein